MRKYLIKNNSPYDSFNGVINVKKGWDSLDSASFKDGTLKRKPLSQSVLEMLPQTKTTRASVNFDKLEGVETEPLVVLAT